MQTFLPYGSFALSAQSLDRQRLGNQRNEAYTLLANLLGLQDGWTSHPAAGMWKGYEGALYRYGLFVCNEWIRRGYVDSVARKFKQAYRLIRGRRDRQPKWLGDERLHGSHRAALLAKNYSYYERYGWSEKPVIDYWWPIGHTGERCLTDSLHGGLAAGGGTLLNGSLETLAT